MGFYLRKSVSVGPLRFNLSKSGVGVSAGVRGLRFGSGPRGNYIHAGRHGFYYRATLPSGAGTANPPASTPLVTDGMTPIDSGRIADMVDSSSADLVAEMNTKQRRWRTWPWVCLLLLFAAGPVGDLANAAGDTGGSVVAVAYFGGWIGLTWAAYRFDVLRKTTVLLYDLEDEAETTYQALHDAFDGLVTCQRAWHLQAEGAISDRKRNAGASTLVNRKAIRLAKRAPKWIETNIEVPAIPAGKETLYFFPDRLLVVTPNGVGAVAYATLSIATTTTRFIEDGGVPREAQVVGHRWQYVNKSGGPDKRFKNNRELPIALYEEMRFTSITGLCEAIQLSRTGVGQPVADAVTRLATLQRTAPV